MRKNNAIDWVKLLWHVGLFAFMYIWFTQIHPLVVFDADDWSYISSARPATPTIHQWNPAKVFPELLMPFCGGIAAYVIQPIIGDYVLSFTLVSAAVVSLFISVYVYCFGSCLKSVMQIDEAGSVCLEILFFLFHFLVFFNHDTNNQYMFYCHDLNCYYNYLIPALLNSSMVMLMMRSMSKEGLSVKHSTPCVTKGLIYMAIYFAVFSNLADSYILAIYCGIAVLSALLSKNKDTWKTFIQKNEYSLLVLGLWVISAVFEISGGRAAAKLGNNLSFVEGVKQSCIGLIAFLFRFNRFFAKIVIITIIVAFVLFIRSRSKSVEDKSFLCWQIKLVFAALLALIYTILLCAKVNAEYITRSDYLFGIYFYGLLILMVAVAYIIKKKPAVIYIFPLLLCIVAARCNAPERTFKESNTINQDPRICMEISRDLVEQVTAANHEGKGEMVLHVLKYEHPRNWPQATYFGDYISRTLHKHGIVSERMEITVYPDVMMNEKYGIN